MSRESPSIYLYIDNIYQYMNVDYPWLSQESFHWTLFFLPKMLRGYHRARCSSGLEAFPKVRNISGQGRFAGRGYYGFAVQWN